MEQSIEKSHSGVRSNGLIRPYHSKLLALARLIDGLYIYVTLWTATYIRDIDWQTHYGWLALAGLLLYNFFAEYNEIYYEWRGSSIYREAARIALAWFGAVVALIVIGFMTKTSEAYSRIVIISWIILTPLCIILWHAGCRIALGYLRSQGRNMRTIAVVGANELGRRLTQSFASMPWLGYRNLGYYDDRSEADSRRLKEAKIIGDFATLYQDARDGKIDVIYITLPLCAEKRVEKIINRLANTTVSVYFIPDLFVFNLLHARWTTIQGIPAVSVYDTPFYHLDGITKRLEDILLSSIILLIIAIPMLLIGLGIKLTSPGPVLFKQRRYGMRGETIEVWKFRTMTVCEDGETIKQAVRNDSRVTPFGRFLRRTSLDELPQFINVLQGKMSVVGPRPHAVAHNELYRKNIHGYMLRHKVKPGITGLAQVNGYRGEIQTEEMLKRRIQNDLEYIRQWSLLLDFKIVFLTIFKGFLGERAY